MPMGLHAKPPPHGHRRPLQPLPQDGDETVPLINGGLAAKAMKGRQSIAQFNGCAQAKVTTSASLCLVLLMRPQKEHSPLHMLLQLPCARSLHSWRCPDQDVLHQ